MQIAIRYLTTFTYDTEVSESHNTLRARPAEGADQHLIRYQVQVDPEARVFSHQDYWGTWVDTFGIVGRHTRLTVVADAEVQTAAPPQPDNGATFPVSGVDDLFEYLTATPHVAWDGDLIEFGREAVSGCRTATEAAQAVQSAVGSHLTYETGATEVGTSVAEIFSTRRGVCQDYAHLALAVYRSLGWPARYVSGYLYASDSASGLVPEDEAEIEVATHAWVEVAIPGHGWWGLDPTNQLVAGERHIKIGHGRDYEDVTPLRGIYHGEAESGGLEARVKMSRAGLETYRMSARPSRPAVERNHHHQQ